MAITLWAFGATDAIIVPFRVVKELYRLFYRVCWNLQNRKIEKFVQDFLFVHM